MKKQTHRTSPSRCTGNQTNIPAQKYEQKLKFTVGDSSSSWLTFHSWRWFFGDWLSKNYLLSTAFWQLFMKARWLVVLRWLSPCIFKSKVKKNTSGRKETREKRLGDWRAEAAAGPGLGAGSPHGAAEAARGASWRRGAAAGTPWPWGPSPSPSRSWSRLRQRGAGATRSLRRRWVGAGRFRVPG